MFADTVTQTKFVVKPARVVRCKVLDAVCVLPFNVFRELNDASNAIEQARDEFENACQSADAHAIAQAFEILQSTIITSHSKQLQAVQQYGVEVAR